MDVKPVSFKVSKVAVPTTPEDFEVSEEAIQRAVREVTKRTEILLAIEASNLFIPPGTSIDDPIRNAAFIQCVLPVIEKHRLIEVNS